MSRPRHRRAVRIISAELARPARSETGQAGNDAQARPMETRRNRRVRRVVWGNVHHAEASPPGHMVKPPPRRWVRYGPYVEQAITTNFRRLAQHVADSHWHGDWWQWHDFRLRAETATTAPPARPEQNCKKCSLLGNFAKHQMIYFCPRVVWRFDITPGPAPARPPRAPPPARGGGGLPGAQSDFSRRPRGAEN